MFLTVTDENTYEYMNEYMEKVYHVKARNVNKKQHSCVEGMCAWRRIIALPEICVANRKMGRRVYMHSVFDIIGPTMIGPSSSHTAGAVRIGLLAGKVLGEPVIEARIALYGSFQATYRGHGTDKALVAGILGFAPDDERIRDSPAIAKAQGMHVTFSSAVLDDAHPNTAILHLTGVSGREVKVQGASIGGGNILITNIDGYEIELSGAYPALISVHHDIPGVITKVTGIMARYELNIAFMSVSRKRRGETAMMIIQLDDQPTDEVLEECAQVYGVESAMSIPRI